MCVCVLDERSPLFHILLIRFYTVEEKGKGGLGFDYKERKREKREGPGLASRPTARTTQPRVKALFFPTCFFFRSVLSLYGLAQHVISVCVSLSLFSRLVESIQSAGLAAPVRTSFSYPLFSLVVVLHDRFGD